MAGTSWAAIPACSGRSPSLTGQQLFVQHRLDTKLERPGRPVYIGVFAYNQTGQRCTGNYGPGGTDLWGGPGDGTPLETPLGTAGQA